MGLVRELESNVDAGRRGMPLRLSDLSDRERGIVDRLLRGCRARDIAFALGLSEATVNCQLANIRRKLAVRNSVEIARLAFVNLPLSALLAAQTFGDEQAVPGIRHVFWQGVAWPVIRVKTTCSSARAFLLANIRVTSADTRFGKNENTRGRECRPPQVVADGFATDTGGAFNAPQCPSQPSQRDDLLLLFFVQDIAH